MDLSAKLYHDECIACRNERDLDKIGDGIAAQLPKFTATKSRLSQNELRLDLQKSKNFLGMLLGKRMGITVNAKMQSGNLLLSYSNGDFFSKLIFTCLSGIFFAFGIALFFIGVWGSFAAIAIAKAMGTGMAGTVIKMVIMLLIAVLLYVIGIGNIIGFIKQIKLGKKISRLTRSMIEQNAVEKYAAGYRSKHGTTGQSAAALSGAQYAGSVQNAFAPETASSPMSSRLKRVFIFLEDEEFDKANEYCEKVLDEEPENADAYLGKLMAECHVTNKEELAKYIKEHDMTANKHYKRFMQYASEEQLALLRQTAKCPNCGSVVDSDMDFCIFCGAKLEW